MTLPPDLNFARPFWVILVLGSIAIPVLYTLLELYREKVLNTLKLSPEIKRSRFWHRLKVIFFSLSWLFAALALMEPQGSGRYPDDTTAQKRPRNVTFLLDVSDSMSVNDTRLGISRLERAKEIVSDLAFQLAGGKQALASFTTELMPLVPSTVDALFTRLMVSRVTINEGGVPGTDFLASFEELKNWIGNEPQTVILLSDGGDTKWESLSGTEKKERLEAIASVFENTEVSFVAIGVGSSSPQTIPGVKFEGQPVTTKLQRELLEALGPYFEANQKTALGLRDAVLDALPTSSADVKAPSLEYTSYFQVPLFFSLLFLVAALYFPETKNRAFVKSEV